MDEKPLTVTTQMALLLPSSLFSIPLLLEGKGLRRDTERIKIAGSGQPAGEAFGRTNRYRECTPKQVKKHRSD